MSKHIQLSIADPCHENWDKMTKAEQCRFCVSCQKQVMDFTRMSDSQIATFFKKPLTRSVCGRFYEDQLDRNIEIPKKHIPWVKYFFQFALPAFLFSMKAAAQGKVKVTCTSHAVPVSTCAKKLGEVGPIEKKILVGDTDFAPVLEKNSSAALLKGQIDLNKEPLPNSSSVKGRVVDKNNSPISFATVMLKSTQVGTSADSSGVFNIGGIILNKDIILDVS